MLTTLSQSEPISPLPPGPPGFSVDYFWNRSKALNPLGLYVTAIKLMYGLSKQPWSSPVELLESGLCIISQQPDYNVIILTADRHPGTTLTTGMVVKVLYESVTDMATREPGFYQINDFITLNGETIGKMIIDSNNLLLNHEGVLNATLTADFPHNIASSHPTERDIGDVTQPSNSNEIIDPHDRRLKITWEWGGKNIPAQDIFSAAFNGLAASALYDHDGPCEYITALSASGNAVFHIGRSTRTTVFAGVIARAFYLLINQLFLVQRRFEELWIYLSINGINFADGYIHKVGRVGAGNSTQGVASE